MRALPFLCIATVAAAQSLSDPYSTGAAFVSSQGCPIFLLAPAKGSPAERAGIRGGDRLAAVNGTRVTSLDHARKLVQSAAPVAVTVRVIRGNEEVEIFCQRERQSAILARIGKKITSGGLIVPQDTTQAEVDRDLALDWNRLVGRVFRRTHYPADPNLFYPGFELFLLRDPAEVMVGGIEDGPGSKAGVHYGDVVISVNGTSVAGKSSAELEALFSSAQASVMHLRVDRAGTIRNFDFMLERASDVAAQNGQRLVAGGVVPLGVRDEDLHCFVH
jgi:predicted metalloprotease with PDZ domain